jgi:protein-L-isoaspartate(D-aspartate) O-methyltransferase
MSKRVAAAMDAIARKHFLPREVVREAEWDMPLPIGFGQTNSQPSTVRLMLEWLDVHPGQKVLDVGSGSGWTTALLAHLTGENGQVIAVERIPELVAFGRENCARLGISNVKFHPADKVYGYPESAPYDRILVSAAAQAIPAPLVEQLAGGGRMVVPVQGNVIVVTKDDHGNIDQQSHPGFIFVPLV